VKGGWDLVGILKVPTGETEIFLVFGQPRKFQVFRDFDRATILE
jgi:hypothetical protein